MLAGRHIPTIEHLADSPAELEKLFARCLATDRALRPRSAQEFFRLLEKTLA